MKTQVEHIGFTIGFVRLSLTLKITWAVRESNPLFYTQQEDCQRAQKDVLEPVGYEDTPMAETTRDIFTDYLTLIQQVRKS